MIDRPELLLPFGTVIATFNGPSSEKFSFVIKDNGKAVPIHTGQFISPGLWPRIPPADPVNS